MGQDMSKLAAQAGGKIKDALDRVGVSLVERLVARREREEERRRERARSLGRGVAVVRHGVEEKLDVLVYGISCLVDACLAIRGVHVGVELSDHSDLPSMCRLAVAVSLDG